MMHDIEQMLNELVRANHFGFPGWVITEQTTKTPSKPNYKNGLGLSRGHNIYVVRDDKGNIAKHVFEIEYTPFTKDQVSVEIEGKYLNVKLLKNGEEKKNDEKEVVFDGIYSDEFEFSFLLPPNAIEDKIVAKCNDGILKIECPVLPPMTEQKKKVRTISIS